MYDYYTYYLHYQTEIPPELKKWDGYPIVESYAYGVRRSVHGFLICKKTTDVSRDDCIRQGLEAIAWKYTPNILTGLSLFALGSSNATATPSEKDTANFQRILQEVQRGSRT